MLDFIANTSNIEGIRKLGIGDFPANEIIHNSKAESGTINLNKVYIEPFYRMCTSDRELGLAVGFTFWHSIVTDRIRTTTLISLLLDGVKLSNEAREYFNDILAKAINVSNEREILGKAPENIKEEVGNAFNAIKNKYRLQLEIATQAEVIKGINRKDTVKNIVNDLAVTTVASNPKEKPTSEAVSRNFNEYYAAEKWKDKEFMAVVGRLNPIAIEVVEDVSSAANYYNDIINAAVERARQIEGKYL